MKIIAQSQNEVPVFFSLTEQLELKVAEEKQSLLQTPSSSAALLDLYPVHTKTNKGKD